MFRFMSGSILNSPWLYINVTIFVALAALAMYRLFLSPLASFPGPHLAALTAAYEGYYDCIKDGGGRYFVEISRMHDVYGPIVRINPWELHIRDPEWNEIYKVARRAHKCKWYYRPLSTSGSSLSSESHEQHRVRRDAIQPYFLAAAVARHEGQVQALVDKMCSQLHTLKLTDNVINIGDVFRALATDVATSFTFGRPFGHLDHEAYEHGSNAALRSFSPLGMLNRQLNGAAYALVKKIPRWIAIRLQSPASDGLRGFYAQIRSAVDDEYKLLDAKLHGTTNIKTPSDLGLERNMVLHILDSSLPPDEKKYERVARECSSVTSAGTETVGSTITAIVFLLLSHPAKAAALSDELGEAQHRHGRKLDYHELRDMPYLTGVISEGFRLNSGVSGRLPRLDPKQEVIYNDMVIPKGTTISITQNDTNFSPDIFPSPSAFLPERWLDADERRRLSKYLQNFGRGTRSCLGMEVAYLEIYLTIGRLFDPKRGVRLQLHDTDWERDVAIFHDYFAPFPWSRNGVRATVVS